MSAGPRFHCLASPGGFAVGLLASLGACFFDPGGVTSSAPAIDAAPAIDSPSVDAAVSDGRPIDGAPADASGIDAGGPACLFDSAYVADPSSGRRYRVVTDTGAQASWGDAHTDCLGDGAHLAVIDSDVENNYIQGQLGPDTTWIGLHDMNSEGNFEWVTGTPRTYTNWNDGEPNDAGWGAEDCAGMLTSGLWNDEDCGTPHLYVCECDPDYMP